MQKPAPKTIDKKAMLLLNDLLHEYDLAFNPKPEVLKAVNTKTFTLVPVRWFEEDPPTWRCDIYDENGNLIFMVDVPLEVWDRIPADGQQTTVTLT